jgi:hypothetical protein
MNELDQLREINRQKQMLIEALELRINELELKCNLQRYEARLEGIAHGQFDPKITRKKEAIDVLEELLV